MISQEKLQRIRAKCVELLAIAEKRTPGEWRGSHKKDGDVVSDKQELIADTCFWHKKNQAINADSDFIASCAGPAEAGWRSTIAAIDDSIRQPVPEGWCHPDNPVHCENTPLINAILSSWPDELL